MTHTPGHWKYLPDERMVESALPGWKGEFEHICDLRSPVSEANAALIAAAPELLAALEHCLCYLESDADDEQEQRDHAQAKAAIEKARGL